MLSALVCLLAMSTAQAQTTDYAFRLKNVLNASRTAETIEVDVPATLDLTACTLLDEEGQPVPFEVTAYGRARFQATLCAGEHGRLPIHGWHSGQARTADLCSGEDAHIACRHRVGERLLSLPYV